MGSRPGRAVLAAAPLVAVLALAACSEEPRDPARAAPSTPPATEEPGATATATPGDEGSPTTSAPTDQPTEAAIEVLATGFEVPWGLVVLDDGTAVIGERDTAQVWWLPPEGEPVPVGIVPDVAPAGEGGLLGLAVPPGGDPATVYAYYTSAADNRVARVTFTSGSRTGDPQVTVVLDGIPKGRNHNGGRLAFGPDGFLYVSTGDASRGELAQDPNSLAGKILRITPDGEPAPGNPDADSPVWSMGHRNVQGLAWDADGRLWATEFGQSTFDEINLIEPGGNYGWPEVEGTGGAPSYVDPVVTWATSDASPSGLAVGPDGALYAAALAGRSLWRVPLDGARVGEPERLLHDVDGRLRSVVTGPDDALYVLTSNTFRGEPAPEDDRLLRIARPDLLRP
jgi:glucose/arabinose dehydrogenase